MQTHPPRNALAWSTAQPHRNAHPRDRRLLPLQQPSTRSFRSSLVFRSHTSHHVSGLTFVSPTDECDTTPRLRPRLSLVLSVLLCFCWVLRGSVIPAGPRWLERAPVVAAGEGPVPNQTKK